MKKHFGQIIAEVRKAKNLTQIELAEKVGVSRRTIQLLENENTGRIEILWRCIVFLEIDHFSLK